MHSSFWVRRQNLRNFLYCKVLFIKARREGSYAHTNKDKPKRSKIKSFFKWLSIITLILILIGGAIIGTLFFIEESTRSGGGGGAISKAISRSYTEMGEQKCSRCKTSADCSWACEQYCGEQGYDGQEGSFGRDEKNLGGLLSTSYCSCRCYNEG